MPNKAKTSKINIWARIISLLLIFSLLVQFNTPLQTVQASGVNAYNGTTGGYTEPAELPYAGSVERSGIVFYVADSHGNQYKLKGKKIPPIVFMEGKGDKEISNSLATTRCGAITFNAGDIKDYPDDLPPAIKWDGSTWTGNGIEIGNYLLKASGQKTAYGVDIYNWEVLLGKHGGDDWTSIIDDLHDGTKDMTLCIETLAINYVYYKPMRVTVTPYTQSGWYEYTQTRTITTDSEGNKKWSDSGWTASTFQSSGEQSGGDAVTYPSADGAYYLPMSNTDTPNVYFGTQSGLAGPGQMAESTDLNNLVAQNKLGLLRTDVNNPETAFNATLVPEPANWTEVGWTSTPDFYYGNGVDAETALKNGAVGTTYTRKWIYSYSKNYNRATVEQADDKIANYKWMQIVLPYSLCLDHTQLGISKPSMIANEEPVPFDKLVTGANEGYGISMFDDQLIKAEINTYDGIYSPGNTEDPHENKKGHNYVVKAYMTITKDQNGNIISEEPSGLYERKTKGDLADTVCNIININDEPKGFKLKNWWISDTYAQTTEPQIYKKDIPGSVRKRGTSPTQVQLEGTEENGGECLYVLLVKVITKTIEDRSDTIKIQLEQSEITKKVDFNNSNKGIIKEGCNALINYMFTYRLDAYADHQGFCSGHSLENSNDHGEGSSKKCVWNWDDNSLKFALKPHDGYDKKIFVSKDEWKPIVTTGTGSYDTNAQTVAATRSNATTNHEIQHISGWNFVTVIHRGEDPITLFKWKNDKLGLPANNDLSGIDGIAIDNQKQGNRNTADHELATDLEIVRNTEKDDLATARKNMQNRGGGTVNPCDNTAERGGDLLKGDITEFVGVSTLKTNTFKVEVTYKTYSGNPNYAGTDEVNNPVTTGKVDSSDLTISPYIYMRYQTTSGETGAMQKVSAVLGNYDRTLTGMFSSAELKDNKVWNEGLMKLDSLQWSTHKRAEAGHEVSTVLPGGATFTLSVPTNNRKKVHLWTYQPVLVGDGKDMQEATKGVPNEFTLDQAKANHNGAVADVLTAMNNLHIQQFQLAKDLGKPNPNEIYLTENDTDTQCVFDGINEQGHEPVFNNTNMSTDEKYYLRGLQGESNSSYIDARNFNPITKYYTIYADASDGKLYIKISDNKDNCTAEGGIEITNPSVQADVARIDSKTGIVTALKNALERGSGSDTGAEENGYNPPLWATNGKWYNEAFDGITMVEMNTTLELGLVNTAERSSVLDPKLTPSSANGRESMLKQFYTAQFLTEDHSELGTFKGTNIPVVNGTTKHWLHSKLFYVPNATTQDLK